MIAVDFYRRVRDIVAEHGYREEYEWAQSVRPPETPEAMVCEYAWVVINSGMRHTVARSVMDRVWPRIAASLPIGDAFGHRGKVHSIETVWQRRAALFESLQSALPDVAVLLDWCEALPWIGPITKYHLAKNLGADVAKPDRWLERLAVASNETVDALCARLARATGDRVATVDVVLWRACAIGVLAVSGLEVKLRP